MYYIKMVKKAFFYIIAHYFRTQESCILPMAPHVREIFHYQTARSSVSFVIGSVVRVSYRLPAENDCEKERKFSQKFFPGSCHRLSTEQTFAVQFFTKNFSNSSNFCLMIISFLFYVRMFILSGRNLFSNLGMNLDGKATAPPIFSQE